MSNFYSYPHRTLCGVLDEMRKLDKTKNYSTMASLIEEAQTLGNRMEAGLDQQKDYFRLRDAFKKKKKEYEKLEKKLKKLKKKDKK